MICGATWGKIEPEGEHMKVLITGITGFAGSHLAELLLRERGYDVHGTVRPRSRGEHLQSLQGQVVLHDCDLCDAASVRSVLRAVQPERIFHLAAQSFVPFSWSAPAQCLTDNTLMQVHLFEEARALGLDPMIQIACSSEEYGFVHEHELPIRESNPLRPLSPYAVSKVSQDYLGYQYFKSYGTRAVRTRGFNHEGPRRGEVFVTSNFARQVAEIESGKREPVLKVGNLDAVRDFTDVRDMVRAYHLALERGEPGEVYNVCSGKGYSVRQVVEILEGLAARRFEVVPDPARMRPSDVPRLVGDFSKFKAATGWEPRIPFEQTMKDLLDYWRARVA
jgi:GDP-4-dehydro-6-deoxy-D-mannose reductase